MRTAVAAGALAFLAYWSTLQTPVSGDANSHVYLSFSFIREGNADLDEYAGLGDTFVFHAQRIGEHLYSPYLPGNALLYAPAALVADWLGVEPASTLAVAVLTKLLASLLVAFSVGCVYLALGAIVERRAALLFTLAYALGTAAFAVSSQLFWEHGPSLGLLALGLLLVVRGGGTGEAGARAGLPLALAVLVRPMNALLATAVLGFYLHRRRAAVPRFLLWAAGPAAFLATFDTVLFGSPERWTREAYFFGTGEGILGLLVSPSRGLLVYSPFLLFALIALAAAWRGTADDLRWLLRYASLAFVSSLLLFGSYGVWWGGWSYGNRYLTDLLPVYALALGDGWRRGWLVRAAARYAFAAAVGWSVLLQAAGAGLNYFYWNGRHWDATPDIGTTPWRLWSWSDAQWEFILRRLVNDPGPAMVVEACVVVGCIVAFALLARRPRASAPVAGFRQRERSFTAIVKARLLPPR